MIAHSYEAVRTDPDCTHMGYTTYTCSVCGDSYKADFVDAAGHDCEATVVAPTCEGYGYTENHCKHCDYTYISEIRQPLGHADKLTGAKEATCTEPGYTGDMVCTRCGEVHSKGEGNPCPGPRLRRLDDGEEEADCFTLVWKRAQVRPLRRDRAARDHRDLPERSLHGSRPEWLVSRVR